MHCCRQSFCFRRKRKNSLESSEDLSLVEKEEKPLLEEKKIEDLVLAPLQAKGQQTPIDSFSISLSVVPFPKVEHVHESIQEWIKSQVLPVEHRYERALSPGPGSTHQTNKIRSELVSSVCRFMRDSDKICQVSSVVMKSRSYHLHHSTPRDKSILPIMDLPRTDMSKPFIPDAPTHIFNVSHQYPIVAAVQLKCGDNLRMDESDLHVGIDVVVLETDPVKRQGLRYLSSAFTEWEWDEVTRLEFDEIEWTKEILVKWSMKEAYTKAIGIGMGMDFDLLEFRFEEINREEGKSSWNQLIRSDIHGVKKRVHVVLYKKSSGNQIFKEEYWNFSFFDPWNLCRHLNKSINSNSPLLSCACVCDGPHPDASASTSNITIDVEVLTLSELTQWHNPQL